MVLVETEKMKADVRYEIRQLNKLRKDLKEEYANRPAKPASDSDGM
jgi:hypothetical protein